MLWGLICFVHPSQPLEEENKFEIWGARGIKLSRVWIICPSTDSQTFSTCFDLFQLICEKSMKPVIGFEICFRCSNLKCLFPGYVGSCHALMVSVSTTTRWKLPNMHVCQPFPMRLFPIVRSKRASKKEGNVKVAGRQQSKVVDRDPLSLQRIPRYWLHRRTP